MGFCPLRFLILVPLTFLGKLTPAACKISKVNGFDFCISAYYGVLVKMTTSNYWFFISLFEWAIWCMYAVTLVFAGIVTYF